MSSVVLLLAISIGCAIAAPAKDDFQLPTFVKSCYRDQDNLSACLKDAVQDFLPRMAQGSKELGVPPLEPYVVAESVYQYGNGLVTGKSTITDAHVYGLTKAKVTKFEANLDDPNNIILDAELHEEDAKLTGNFNWRGSFLGFPIKGKGPFTVTGSDVTIHWRLTGFLAGNNGEKYLKIKSFLVTPHFATMHIDADNLYEGNPAVSKAMIDLVNQYWRIGYEDNLPTVQVVWDKLFRSIANSVFQKVPFDKLFPTSQ